ncbi:LAMI_0D04016g1_1 [Lachancea mirantina]|uniref:Signal recognition particle receptor subunit alpha homolog n=1 Tax=Lachancea mirantina TaxID=1230905 RepID=A0A1G4JA70_9SACH|nr:LAMI_0D04016g1_1 [Lachancea mirantina]
MEQFVVFRPSGEVLYHFGASGRKLQEQQVNKIVSELVGSPPRKTSNNGFPVINLGSFAAMYTSTMQPHVFYLVTFAAETLELSQLANKLLQLGTDLWASLGLNEIIAQNLSGRNEKNEHNFTWCLNGAGELIGKFGEYFGAKFDEICSETRSLNGEAQQQTQAAPSLLGSVSKAQGKSKSKKKPQKGTGVKNRKWGRDGIMEDTYEGDSSTLDFSESASDFVAASESRENSVVDESTFGTRTGKGEFLIKEIDELLSKSKEVKSRQQQASTTTGAFGFLQKHLMGNKTISTTDLKTTLDKFRQKLITKNVAPEAAEYLCSQISQDLVGSKTPNWTSVEAVAKQSLQTSLTNILTPGVSVDLLREIQEKTATVDGKGHKSPYVFSVVGVNGVGKSTNLSKLAFWLLQNNLKVLIVACDTFRSGAVEQLRVHVENLAQLTDSAHKRGSKNKRGKTGNDHVELFESGYGGSDLVTKIAKQAINYARDNAFDIVLMDTAGRRHNDPTLMSPLKSFADQANPDKIIMVGEALVGTDSVQQAQNFNAAFGKERNLDFFIVSKCDTVGDMLGAMVNMVYATGIPILFVGVGQTYTDLRTLSVKWAVDTLMS